MAKPSVLLIHRNVESSYDDGGRMAHDLAHVFRREGWRVTVLTTGRRARAQKENGLRFIRLTPGTRTESLAASLRVLGRLTLRALMLGRHDLVITLSNPPFLILTGAFLKRVKKSKHIHWCYKIYPDLLPVLGHKMPEAFLKTTKRRVHKAMNECDRLIIADRSMARNLLQSGVQRERMALIPCWSDLELTRPAEKNVFNGASKTASTSEGVPMARAMPRDDGPKFRILYAGEIGPAHPMRTVLDAAEILDDSDRDIEFVFVGAGPGFESLALERARRGLHNIRLLPFQPQEHLRRVMKIGDLHLITEKEEMAGLAVSGKLYAALAVGRPILFIGSSKAEAARVIGEHKAGKVFGPDDAAGLADCIRHYRRSGDAWHEAREGALRARAAYPPTESLRAWVKRAYATVAGR